MTPLVSSTFSFNGISVISCQLVLLFGETEYSEKTIVLSEFTEEIYHIKLYRVHLAMSEIQAHRVSGDRH
jgi:hypothetical protein